MGSVMRVNAKAACFCAPCQSLGWVGCHRQGKGCWPCVAMAIGAPKPLKHHFQSVFQVVEMDDYFSDCYMMFLL
jgi:hypothetical protein